MCCQSAATSKIDPSFTFLIWTLSINSLSNFSNYDHQTDTLQLQAAAMLPLSNDTTSFCCKKCRLSNFFHQSSAKTSNAHTLLISLLQERNRYIQKASAVFTEAEIQRRCVELWRESKHWISHQTGLLAIWPKDPASIQCQQRITL